MDDDTAEARTEELYICAALPSLLMNGAANSRVP